MVEVDKVISDAEGRMKKSVEAMGREVMGLRTGRATTALVENIIVDCHGATLPLKQVSSITVKDATTLSLSVWDEDMVRGVEKAIIEADIGLTPQVNGAVIHLNIPPLTKERRMELVKMAHKYGETAKVSVRNIRRDANQSLKKDSDLTKDEARRGEERVNAVTQKHIDEIDGILAQKEKEITSA